MDLAPIDEQIGKLKEKLAKLENAKRIILALRGEPQPEAKASGNSNDNGQAQAARTLPDPKELRKSHGHNPAPHVDADDLVNKLHRHLKVTQPQSVGELADYFAMPRLEIQKVLNNSNQFEFGSKGWGLAD